MWQRATFGSGRQTSMTLAKWSSRVPGPQGVRVATAVAEQGPAQTARTISTIAARRGVVAGLGVAGLLVAVGEPFSSRRAAISSIRSHTAFRSA